MPPSTRRPVERFGCMLSLICGSAAAAIRRPFLPSAAGALYAPNSVKVSVSDTGPGIPAEYHLEVFDDFFRLPDAENQADGMGLGLSIVRRLVMAMGGKIWVESDPGAGCKFSFIIPLETDRLRATSKGKNRMQKMPKYCWWTTNRECCGTSRRCSKWTTIKSRLLPRAKKRWRLVEKGLRPDLVLLDLLMPGIDGLQTLEQLRQLQPGRESGDAVLR